MLCLRVIACLLIVGADAAVPSGRSASAPVPAGPFPTAVSGVRNVTVYRLTPFNYTGLSNLDSGDLAGDLGFGLWELLMPMACREDASEEVGCQRGTGRFIDAPGENITYVKLTVEMNTLFTSYTPCNPDPASGIFKCLPTMPGGPGGSGTVCHCDDDRAAAEAAGDCGCENMKSRAVGRDLHGQGGQCLKIRSEEECGSDDTQCVCQWTSSGQCRPIVCEVHGSQDACEAAVCTQGGGRQGGNTQVICAWVPEPSPFAGGDATTAVAATAAAAGHCRRLECSEVKNQTTCEIAQSGYPGGGCNWWGDPEHGRCRDGQQPDHCAATPSPCCEGIQNATECGAYDRTLPF
jgi:hypothetical protein